MTSTIEFKRPKRMPKECLSKDKNHKRGKHSWVAYCPDNINEEWSYCECCGVTRE